MEFIFRKSVQKIQLLLKSDKNNGFLREEKYTVLIICRSVLLNMRNISYKSRRENQNTHFMFRNILAKIVSFMR
jgi:hypothetical protein